MDLFVHRFCEGDSLADGLQNVGGGEFLVGGEGVVEGAVDGFFDFGAAEIRGRVCAGGDIIIDRVAGRALAMWMRNISSRSSWPGKSTKKISSRRPLRRNSGGSWEISLAVATTKTGAVFSESHVRNVPKTRAVVPASRKFRRRRRPAKALSISSTHKMTGAMDSATAMAQRTILFRGTDEAAAEHAAHIETEEGKLPLGGDGLGAKTLAAALDAEH